MKASILIGSSFAALAARAITGGNDVDLGATATGSNSSANSYLLKGTLTSFTTGGAGTGARLPVLEPGDSIIVANYTGSALLLFPSTGGNLNNAGVNASLSLPDKDVILVTCLSPGIYAAPLSGIVNPNAPILPSATVAATGSAQVDAAPIATGITWATAANGTKGILLPAAAAGIQCTIKNDDAANAILKVWPAGTDTINAIAASTSISMAAKTSAVFSAIAGGKWFTTPLVPS